jgi:hypothetical protein
VSAADLCDLEEGVTGHVLHARVLLVHELEQLGHHGAQELPVLLRAEETGVLAHHIPAAQRKREPGMRNAVWSVAADGPPPSLEGLMIR